MRAQGRRRRRWCRSTSLESEGIDRLGGVIAERYGQLDVLIGNAAELGVLAPLGHVEPKVFERVMALNAGANYRLIRSLDPLLRAARRRPRDLRHLQPGAGERGPTGAPTRRARPRSRRSRCATRPRCGAPRVRVNLVDPGPLRTRLRAHAYPGEDPARQPEPATAVAPFLALADPACERHGERLILERPDRSRAEPRRAQRAAMQSARGLPPARERHMLQCSMPVAPR